MPRDRAAPPEPDRATPGDLASARAFLEWLLDDNYIFMGTVRYRIQSDGSLDRIEETATGVFNDMTLLPVVFPGAMEELETPPRARGRATTASSTSTTATTRRPSTTSSRSTTS